MISAKETLMGQAKGLFQCSTRFDVGGYTGNSASHYVSSREG